MFDISSLRKEDMEESLPILFDLLYTNMNRIAPTGNTREQDYQVWKSYRVPEIGQPGRETLLLKLKGSIIGYFQYSLNEATLIMEEIQFDQAYWGSGAFQELYRFLAVNIPDNIKAVKAYVSKKNLKSQAILTHLGLNIVGENKSGNSYLFVGDCQKMLDKYRDKDQ